MMPPDHTLHRLLLCLAAVALSQLPRPAHARAHAAPQTMSTFATEDDAFVPCGVVPACKRPLDIVLTVDVTASQHIKHTMAGTDGGACPDANILALRHFAAGYVKQFAGLYAGRMKPRWKGPAATEGVRVAVVLVGFVARIAIPFTYVRFEQTRRALVSASTWRRWALRYGR